MSRDPRAPTLVRETVDAPPRAKTSAEYQREYRRKHGAELNARRRERYASDPEYARKVREQARRSYYRTQSDPEFPFTKVEGSRVRIGGVTLEVLTPKQVAESLGRTPGAIKHLLMKGLFPEARYRHGKQAVRLYTAEQVELIKTVIRKHLPSARRWPSETQNPAFYADLRQRWTALAATLPTPHQR